MSGLYHKSVVLSYLASEQPSLNICSFEGKLKKRKKKRPFPIPALNNAFAYMTSTLHFQAYPNYSNK